MNPLDTVDLQRFGREINESLILAVLRDRPKHGYQIALDVEARTAGAFTFQHGTLYPILHRLEKEGAIRGAWSTADGRRRKEYRLTPAGRGGLAERVHRFEAVVSALRTMLAEAT